MFGLAAWNRLLKKPQDEKVVLSAHDVLGQKQISEQTEDSLMYSFSVPYCSGLVIDASNAYSQLLQASQHEQASIHVFLDQVWTTATAAASACNW